MWVIWHSPSPLLATFVCSIQLDQQKEKHNQHHDTLVCQRLRRSKCSFDCVLCRNSPTNSHRWRKKWCWACVAALSCIVGTAWQHYCVCVCVYPAQWRSLLSRPSGPVTPPPPANLSAPCPSSVSFFFSLGPPLSLAPTPSHLVSRCELMNGPLVMRWQRL